MTEKFAVLRPDGSCPCGCKDLILAKDQTEYTPVTKGTEWDFGASHSEQMDNDDPIGNVRLFCTACGEYFPVPQELA